MKLIGSEIEKVALELGLNIIQPTSVQDNQEMLQQLTSLAPDIVVSAAYGLFLPADILNLPLMGCLNVHPSLLPQYRGASPVASAILNGDDYTGVTVMKIDEGIDTGPVLAQKEILIKPHHTTDELTMELFLIGAMLLSEVIPAWVRSLPGIQIARQIRAYNSWPVSFTNWKNNSIKIIEATLIESDSTTLESPGMIRLIGNDVGIVTGEGILKIQTIQQSKVSATER